VQIRPALFGWCHDPDMGKGQAPYPVALLIRGLIEQIQTLCMQIRSALFDRHRDPDMGLDQAPYPSGVANSSCTLHSLARIFVCRSVRRCSIATATPTWAWTRCPTSAAVVSFVGN